MNREDVMFALFFGVLAVVSIVGLFINELSKPKKMGERDE